MTAVAPPAVPALPVPAPPTSNNFVDASFNELYDLKEELGRCVDLFFSMLIIYILLVSSAQAFRLTQIICRLIFMTFGQWQMLLFEFCRMQYF